MLVCWFVGYVNSFKKYSFGLISLIYVYTQSATRYRAFNAYTILWWNRQAHTITQRNKKKTGCKAKIYGKNSQINGTQIAHSVYRMHCESKPHEDKRTSHGNDWHWHPMFRMYLCLQTLNKLWSRIEMQRT